MKTRHTARPGMLRMWGLSLLTLVFALTGCGGGGSGADANAFTAPTLDSANAASAPVGPDGGSVTATSADGIRYTLVVPLGALAETVNIRLTPVTSMGVSPLARGLLGAVQMEPSGLTFIRAATLRIDATRAPGNGERLVGFVGVNDGSAIALQPAQVVNGTTVLSISHFSTAGSSTATDAEVAQLPAPGSANPADQFVDELLRLPLEVVLDKERFGPAIADGLRRWYLARVKPQLDAAIAGLASPQDPVKSLLQDPAIDEYALWVETRVRLEVLTNGSTNANSLLVDLDAEARPLVASLLRSRIDALLAECPLRANVNALSFIAYYQQKAVDLVLASDEFGLGNANFLAKVNDCLRPVLDAIQLPSPLVIGTPMSLDAQAKVVFNGSPNPADAPFEFTVIATGATVQRETGKSDASGRYTTVFTPTNGTVEFQVRACLVLQFLDNTRGSDICASQTVSSVIGPEILSGAVGVSTGELFNDGTGGQTNFTGFLRVSVSPDNLVTVVEGSGTRRDDSTIGNSCLEPPEKTILLSSSISYTTTAPSYAQVDPFGRRTQQLSTQGFFLMDGTFDGGTEQRLIDGNTSCAIFNNPIPADAGVRSLVEFKVVAIERDTNGRVIAIDLNRTINAGKTTFSGRLTVN